MLTLEDKAQAVTADASVPILRVEDVTRAFGGLRAVDSCTLSVDEGSI